MKQLVIIGGGAAGLAAAISAFDEGIRDIVIIERSDRLGGILCQCIHNGFGLHTFKEELTGPEYAMRFMTEVRKRNIPILLSSMVIDLKPHQVTYINSTEGVVTLTAKAIILAMGCRERPRGALNIPGYRPAGIFSAGTAQRLMNIEGLSVGRKAVILGSGDIGLIMARRMTLEGAKVLAVAEIMPYSGGLKRNIVQCLDDFTIPLLLSHTVVNIEGKERVGAVTVAKVDERRKPIPGTEKRFECDTLLLSVGLLPENELSEKAGVALSDVTGGPVVDDTFSAGDGIFACGNVLHVHDLVDFVSEEASAAGKSAASYIRGKTGSSNCHCVRTGFGVRYTVPQKIKEGRCDVTIRFRVNDIYRDASIVVKAGDKEVKRIRKRVLAPGEMESFMLSGPVKSDMTLEIDK
ncbi:MAG: NAD(P)/FAD-dependent oxidoreductase [Bullifex sp.]